MIVIHPLRSHIFGRFKEKGGRLHFIYFFCRKGQPKVHCPLSPSLGFRGILRSISDLDDEKYDGPRARPTSVVF